ncbi:MAG: hypothetical protein GXO23_00770 [Crenarchaeota archaeon]|nr:hypothetical protein [Thermoproteota archaeon]
MPSSSIFVDIGVRSIKCIHYGEECGKIVSKGLVNLRREPTTTLKRYIDTVLSSLESLESECQDIDSETYEKELGKCRYALLLLTLALEHQGEVLPPELRGRFTELEKKIAIEVESCSIPEDPKKLAQLFTAGRKDVLEIYRKIIDRSYTDIIEILRKSSERGEIDRYLARYMMSVLEGRLRILAQSLSEVLLSNPVYIYRLFKDYEELVLRASEVRRSVEEDLENRIMRELASLIEKVEALDVKYSSLMDRLSRVVVEGGDVSIGELKRTISELSEENRRLMEKVENLTRELERKNREIEKLKEEIGKYIREVRDEITRKTLETQLESLRTLSRKIRMVSRKLRKQREALQIREEAVKESVRDIDEVSREERRTISASKVQAYYLGTIRRICEKADSIPRETILRLLNCRRWSILKVSKAVKCSPEESSSKIYYRVLYKFSVAIPHRVLMLDIVYYARKDRIVKLGYDDLPLTPVEVNDLMMNVLSENELEDKKNMLYILFIASPTGFSRKLIEHVCSSDPRMLISSRNLIVILYDVVEGRYYYNHADPRAEEIVKVLEPIMEPEKRRIIRDIVLSRKNELVRSGKRELPPYLTYVTLDEILEEASSKLGSVNSSLVLDVFRELENETYGSVCVSPRRGIVFFRFSR